MIILYVCDPRRRPPAHMWRRCRTPGCSTPTASSRTSRNRKLTYCDVRNCTTVHISLIFLYDMHVKFKWKFWIGITSSAKTSQKKDHSKNVLCHKYMINCYLLRLKCCPEFNILCFIKTMFLNWLKNYGYPFC